MAASPAPVAQWIDVGARCDIPLRGARRVTRPGVAIAIFRTHDDLVFALEDRCPHKNGPLSQGIVHGHAVTCPLHALVIDLASGAAAAPEEGCAVTIPARLDGDRILLWLER